MGAAAVLVWPCMCMSLQVAQGCPWPWSSMHAAPMPPQPVVPHSMDMHLVQPLFPPKFQIYANMKFSGPRLADDKRAGFFLGDGEYLG